MLIRAQDNSDAQYSGFRGRIPILTGSIILHFILRRVANAFKVSRLSFDLIFAAIFLTVLHGFSVLKILAIYAINYRFTKSLSKKSGMIATWVFSIVILFLNEKYDGYKYGSIVPALAVLVRALYLICEKESNSLSIIIGRTLRPPS